MEGENTRLQARINSASVTSRRQAQTQEELRDEITKFDENINFLREEIKERKRRVAELAKSVAEARGATKELQNGILSQSNYEKLAKELRQHQVKRNAAAKRLKEARAEKKRSVSANPEGLLSSFENDIAALEFNNVEIRKQIEALQRELDVELSSCNADQYQHVVDEADAGAEALLQKLLDARKRDIGKQTDSSVKSRDAVVTDRASFALNADEHLIEDKERALAAMEKEIEAKTQTRDDLKFIARRMIDDTPSKVAVILSTSALTDATDFEALQKKVRGCVERLDAERSEKTDQFDKLKAEMEAVSAKLTAEESVFHRDAKQQSEYETQFRAMDEEIRNKKDELEFSHQTESKVQNEIAAALQHRVDLRGELDGLMSNEKPETKEIVDEINQIRERYEDAIDRMRVAQTEAFELKQNVEGEEISEEKVDFEYLTKKKERLTQELEVLRSEAVKTDSVVESYQSELNANKNKKDRLTGEIVRYRMAMDDDELEINGLEKYSDKINDLLRMARIKGK